VAESYNGILYSKKKYPIATCNDMDGHNAEQKKSEIKKNTLKLCHKRFKNRQS
jgi:hypothetical protein